MSDFLYISKKQNKGKLTNLLKNIYIDDELECFEYNGEWGSLAVLRNHYSGFDPFENERYIISIIGGPLINFTPVYSFNRGRNEKTIAIYKKWKIDRKIHWDSDLNGPFLIICIDKQLRNIEIVTDLLSFIPAYFCSYKEREKSFNVLGTHVDIVSVASGRNNDLDYTSIADLLINKRVTFPYTIYNSVKQLDPGTSYIFKVGSKFVTESYWIPEERKIFINIAEAAKTIRKKLLKIIDDLCRLSSSINILLSGGEDSRAILASVPEKKRNKAFIFVDYFNTEAKVASDIANIYKTKLEIGYRDHEHYLRNMETAATLVGSQNEFINCHIYGFDKKFGINKLPAVLGGFLADAFLKGNQIKKVTYLKGLVSILKRDRGILENIKKNEKYRDIFKDPIVNNINRRMIMHQKKIKSFRRESADEWFNLWPITMDRDITHFSCNRRLIRSYEPFMSSEIIRLVSSIPSEWKINRRLIQRIIKGILKSSWNIRHSKGYLPYFGFLANIPVSIALKTKDKIKSIFKYNKMANDGPWPDWEKVIETDLMKEKIDTYRGNFNIIDSIFKTRSFEELYNSGIDAAQRLLLLQLFFILGKYRNIIF